MNLHIVFSRLISGRSSRRAVMQLAYLGACLAALPLSGKEPIATEASTLSGLIVQRLNWMDEVAEVKRAKGLPVADPERETALLLAMEKAGAEWGLPAESVRGFFAGQIEAAKVFQREWLAQPISEAWKKRPLPNLAQEVRPALDQLGQQLLVALVEARKSGDEKGSVEAARLGMLQAGFSAAVIEAALAGVSAGLK